MKEIVSYQPFNNVRNFYIQQINGERDKLIYESDKLRYTIDISAIPFVPKSGLLLCPFIEDLFSRHRIETVLDIGTGPSCLLARHAAACGAKLVDATEIDPAILNYVHCHSGGYPSTINIISSDNYVNIPNRKYDLIVSNPAQMPRLHHLHQYHDASGYSGRENLEAIISDATKHLTPNGRLLLLAFGFLGVKSRTNNHTISLVDLIAQRGMAVEKCERIEVNIRPGGGIHRSLSAIQELYPIYQFPIANEVICNEIYILQCSPQYTSMPFSSKHRTSP